MRGRIAAGALGALLMTHGPIGVAGDLPPAVVALLQETADRDAEIVQFSADGRGDAREQDLIIAKHVAARPDALIAALADPATYRRAVPAFVRADVLPSPTNTPADRGRLIAWELEVPLWNFEGQLWLRPTPRGAVMDLVSGDLAPGRLQIDVVAPGVQGRETRATLVLSGSVAIEKANFVTRRLAARDPLAATAMRATAMFVLLRALALTAAATPTTAVSGAPSASGQATARRQPRAPIVPALQAEGPPAGVTFADLGRGAGGSKAAGAAGPAWGVVISRGNGRLDRIAVGVKLPIAVGLAQDRVREPARWRQLPGWSDIDVGRQTWEVDSSLPFVDFDAIWSLIETRPFRAQARAGDWQGPTIGVDLHPGVSAPGESSVMVYTTAPLINRTGYLPRRLIDAEPLLEQGLALGLAFVNARALAGALAR